MSENKTVFEQLEEVQQELKSLKDRQRTLVDQLREDDPKIIEFVKTAKRVWRYNGERSQLKRENQKVEKRSIIGLILLVIYLACSFLFITKPYGWILPIFSSIVCVGQGIIQIFKMRPRRYELEYKEIPSFWRYAELDDNDIISATKDKWWLILLRVCVCLIPLAISVEILLFLDDIWKLLCWLPAALLPLLILPFRDSTIYGYRLHFINDKNDIEYHYLKEFMTRNNLK
jgi:hypothetical protein